MTTRIKPTSITRDEAERLVGEIAEHVNNQREINTQIDAQILIIRESSAGDLAALADLVKHKSALVRMWAEENPDAFGKLKSLALTNGVVGFRTGTPKLSLLNRKWTWDKVLASVAVVLPSFVRSKPAVDKEAIINQREELAEFLPMVGLKVVQEETFFIEPDLTKNEARVTAS